jgi:nicotinamide mononucleotide transporter
MSDFFAFFSIDNVLFTIGKQQVSYLEVMCTLSGLACIYLAVRAKVTNFWVGYLYNILLFPLFLQKGLYSSMILQPISFAINIFGHYRWTHPRKNEENKQHELKISLMNNYQRIIHLLIVVVLTFVWWMMVSKMHEWWPPKYPVTSFRKFLDAFVVVMVLLAQLLAARKKLDCWGAWMTVNVTNVTLYALSGLVFLTFESASKIILATFGFLHWLKKYKKEQVNE